MPTFTPDLTFGPYQAGFELDGAWNQRTIKLASTVAFSLDFTTGSLPGGVTLTRASSAYYVSSGGILTSAAIDTARFDYLVNGSVGATPALLIEAATTNVAAGPTAIGGASWAPNSATSVANAVNGPDNTLTAYNIIEAASANPHAYFQSPALSAGVATVSVYLLAGSRGFAAVQIGTDAFANRYTGVVNLATGALTATSSAGTPVSPSARVEGPINSFYRLLVTATHTTGNCGIEVAISDAAVPTFDVFAQPTYTGNGTSGIYAANAQLELGTGSSWVSGSRSADVVSFTIPAGVSTLRYTFDNGSTQDVSVSPGAYVIPTNLNRPRIRTIVAV